MSQSYCGYYEYATKGIQRKTSSVLNGLVLLRTNDDWKMVVVLEMVISLWVWKSRAKEFADEIGYGV